jgi:hypothetical protein
MTNKASSERQIGSHYWLCLSDRWEVQTSHRPVAQFVWTSVVRVRIARALVLTRVELHLMLPTFGELSEIREVPEGVAVDVTTYTNSRRVRGRRSPSAPYPNNAAKLLQRGHALNDFEPLVFFYNSNLSPTVGGYHLTERRDCGNCPSDYNYST